MLGTVSAIIVTAVAGLSVAVIITVTLIRAVREKPLNLKLVLLSGLFYALLVGYGTLSLSYQAGKYIYDNAENLAKTGIRKAVRTAGSGIDEGLSDLEEKARRETVAALEELRISLVAVKAAAQEGDTQVYVLTLLVHNGKLIVAVDAEGTAYVPAASGSTALPPASTTRQVLVCRVKKGVTLVGAQILGRPVPKLSDTMKPVGI